MTVSSATTRQDVVERAKRLFTFLTQVQRLRTRTVRSVETYASHGGSVLWLADLPDHPAVTVPGRDSAPQPSEPILVVDRVPPAPAPPPPQPLRPWLDGDWEHPDELPTLRESRPRDPADPDQRLSLDDSMDQAEPDDPDEPAELDEPLRLTDYPEILAAYQDWAPRWQKWAERERADAPVREHYKKLFSAYQTLIGNPETMELVVGLGCLSWQPPEHEQVTRHLLTVPATIRFDDRTGRLTVERVESPVAFTLELDMLDPALTNKSGITDIRQEAADYPPHPLDRDEVGTLVKRLVHSLDAEGVYDAGDTRPRPGGHAAAAFAPAVILRRRS